MGYIADLRRFVGSDALIGVGATVLVINDTNQILFNLRTDTNTWGLPGGSMELFERKISVYGSIPAILCLARSKISSLKTAQH